MVVDIENMIQLLGDCSIISVISKDQVVTLNLEADDFELARLTVKSSSFFSALDQRGKPFNHGILKLMPLNDEIDSKNGYYVPPQEFPQLMSQIKNCFQLAWGRRTQDCRHMLYFVGSQILFAAPIDRFHDVKCELVP